MVDLVKVIKKKQGHWTLLETQGVVDLIYLNFILGSLSVLSLLASYYIFLCPNKTEITLFSYIYPYLPLILPNYDLITINYSLITPANLLNLVFPVYIYY